jgi:hypothetical protein
MFTGRIDWNRYDTLLAHSRSADRSTPILTTPDPATYAATTRSTGLRYYAYQQSTFRKAFVVRNHLLP